MKRNTGNGCGSRNKTHKPFGEERAEMGAEERAKRLTDIAKIVEEKAKDIDRCHMEGSYETDKPWEEMVFWLWKARECVDSLLVAPGGQNIDMTKPQPCTKFRDAERMAWIAKLIEETHEVVQEAQIVAQLEKADEEALSTVFWEARKRLAMELTDVKTLCESWLYAEGWDEEERGELQRLVNEKNRERGYF